MYTSRCREEADARQQFIPTESRNRVPIVHAWLLILENIFHCFASTHFATNCSTVILDVNMYLDVTTWLFVRFELARKVPRTKVTCTFLLKLILTYININLNINVLYAKATLYIFEFRSQTFSRPRCMILHWAQYLSNPNRSQWDSVLESHRCIPPRRA